MCVCVSLSLSLSLLVSARQNRFDPRFSVKGHTLVPGSISDILFTVGRSRSYAIFQKIYIALAIEFNIVLVTSKSLSVSCQSTPVLLHFKVLNKCR